MDAESVGAEDGPRLRSLSRKLVLTELSGGQAMSQPELVGRTGLSRTTVAAVVAELEGQGRIRFSQRAEPVRGRPARLLSLRLSEGHVGAVDLGHHHLTVAVADSEGQILDERSLPLDVDLDAGVAMDAAVVLLQESMGAAAAHSLLGVAMGIPGPVERHGASIRSGTVLKGWVGFQPRLEFQRRFGPVPVAIENDAHLEALGEHSHGAGRGHRNMLYIKASSGIGAGTILDNRLYRGSHGTSGEIGHVQVREDGEVCRCGSRGCLETVASLGFALRSLRAIHGPGITLPDLQELLRRGDDGACRLLEDVGTSIGRVVAAVASHLDPELIVVGGPLVDTADALIHGMTTALHRYTQPYVGNRTVVVAGQLGARAGVLGAVAVSTHVARAARFADRNVVTGP